MARDAQGHGSDPAIADVETEKILQALRTGASLEACSAYAGIPRSTFFRWLTTGRRPDAEPIYRQLAEQVDEALAVFEVTAMARITKAGEEQWQADAWRLERKFPDRYGRRTRVDGNVTVQAVPFIDTSQLTIEEQEQLLTLLRKAQPQQDQLPADGRPALELLTQGDEADEA